jgi:hypothetical protein
MNARNLSRTVLLALFMLSVSAASYAGVFDVGVTVGFAPPPLPVYEQPPIPGPGYLWTPGYWAYGADAGYYWVPGTWVLAPAPGLLWTPGYWGAVNGYYAWNAGYWGPHIGFYGGINYGCGYFGAGFDGGYWRDRDFFYNRAVTNVSNVNITNVYNNRVVNNNLPGNRASYNGGGGVHARPTNSEIAAAHEPHRGMTSQQTLQAQSARTVRSLQASVNHGQPPITATARPGVFEGRAVAPAQHASIAPWAPAHASPDSRARTLTPRTLATAARNAPTSGSLGGNRERPPPQEMAGRSDRPAWAYQAPSERPQSLTRPGAQAVRGGASRSGFDWPTRAYGHTTGAGPGPRYARTQSAPPTRRYAPQIPSQHWAQPRTAQGYAVPRGNAGAVRSSPPPHMNSSASRHDARRA